MRGSGDAGGTAAVQASVCTPFDSKPFQMQALLLCGFGKTGEDRFLRGDHARTHTGKHRVGGEAGGEPIGRTRPRRRGTSEWE